MVTWQQSGKLRGRMRALCTIWTASLGHQSEAKSIKRALRWTNKTVCYKIFVVTGRPQFQEECAYTGNSICWAFYQLKFIHSVYHDFDCLFQSVFKEIKMGLENDPLLEDTETSMVNKASSQNILSLPSFRSRYSSVLALWARTSW